MSTTRRVATPKSGRPRGAGSFDAEGAPVVGAVIRKVWESAGISQESLADMANVGRASCGSIDRGESQPTLFVVLKIAAALEVEGHVLVRQVEHALARSRFGGKATVKR